MGNAEATKLGGASAVKIVFPCPAHQVNAELILTVHAGTGWAVLCAVDDGATGSFKGVCDPMLASFRYL